MPTPIRLYFPSPVEVPDLAGIEGEENHYLTRVLRARPGDAVILFGFDSRQRKGVIETVERDRSWVQITSVEESQTESKVSISLVIAVGKGKKLEEIVETTTALGISRIIPFISGRSVAKRSNTDLVRKLQRIAIESCRQSRRVRVPEIHEVQEGLKEALASIQESGRQIVFLDERGGRDLVELAWKLDPEKPIALLIGPEGGWEESERELLLKSGVTPASLGPRILRTELAPIVGVSILERTASFRLTDKSLESFENRGNRGFPPSRE
jgi:16S rRNA (uracil1498-N3)-methyltransferase